MSSCVPAIQMSSDEPELKSRSSCMGRGINFQLEPFQRIAAPAATIQVFVGDSLQTDAI